MLETISNAALGQVSGGERTGQLPRAADCLTARKMLEEATRGPHGERHRVEGRVSGGFAEVERYHAQREVDRLCPANR